MILSDLIHNTAPKLYAIDEALFSHKPFPDKWSKKEIIGHLIDSAANNHQRFVRVQFEDQPKIKYDQDKWNAHGYYQSMDGKKVIDFWVAYNLHLAELINLIPAVMMDRICIMGENSYTLGFIIEDYVAHMQHHLNQVFEGNN
jgi:DinB superfamily